MRSKIKILGFCALLGLFLMTGGARNSYAQEEEGFLDRLEDLLDGVGDGDGGAGAGEEGDDGTVSCCSCLSSDCCFIVQASTCDPDGEIGDSEFLDTFFGILGIEGSAICDLCNQCAKNILTPSEDQQFLDICDFCAGEDLFEALQCEFVPPETSAAFSAEGNSSCRLNPDAGANGGFTWFWIGGILTLLGWRWGADSPRHT